MSKISETLQEMEEKLKRDEEGCEELKEAAKTSVTVRLDALPLWKLDYLANRYGISRSRFAGIIFENSLLESMEFLGFDANKQFEMFIDSIRSDKESK